MIIRPQKPCPNCGHKILNAHKEGDYLYSEDDPDNEDFEFAYYALVPFVACMHCGTEWDISIKRKEKSPDEIMREALLPHTEPYMRPISMTGRSIKQWTRKIGKRR